MYDGPIYYIIEHEWQQNLPIISVYVVTTRVVPLISLLLLLTNPMNSTFSWISFSITIIQLISECRQINYLGLRDYFEEYLNILDLTGVVSGIVWLSEYIKRCIKENDFEEQSEECIAINKEENWYLVYIQFLWTLMLTTRSSEIFKLYKTHRELYVIIEESISDSKAFIIIYIYMLFQISTMMKAQFINEANGTGYHWLDQIGSVFALTLGFGDPPLAKLSEDGGIIQPGDWVIFLFAMYLINIVIFNTLIAILGDS